MPSALADGSVSRKRVPRSAATCPRGRRRAPATPLRPPPLQHSGRSRLLVTLVRRLGPRGRGGAVRSGVPSADGRNVPTGAVAAPGHQGKRQCDTMGSSERKRRDALRRYERRLDWCERHGRCPTEDHLAAELASELREAETDLARAKRLAERPRPGALRATLTIRRPPPSRRLLTPTVKLLLPRRPASCERRPRARAVRRRRTRSTSRAGPDPGEPEPAPAGSTANSQSVGRGAR